MEITDYQAQYLAYELTRRYPSDSLEKLAGAVASAQVDLNPHQVDAALFAFRSPLSNGALLADEVGLGKTIEAGLVIAQKWAERKRRILIITPANLRKQWLQEMQEKFALPGVILESRSYNLAAKAGQRNPFDAGDALVLCSYQFARAKADDVQAVRWDLVVMDEAHRLRNVYKTSNVIARALKAALDGKNKLLLTATPLQNSLLELYGLVSLIDERIFGDLISFREQFGNLNQDSAFNTLRDRLRPVCHRTLRKNVTAYIPYTNRHAILEEFTPAADEDALYEMVSEYLQRENLQALPASQRVLITLVLRKLLASSTFAIAGALSTMSRRLQGKLDRAEADDEIDSVLEDDYEALHETAEEWATEAVEPKETKPLTPDDRAAIQQEIHDLETFIALAESVGQNAKGTALLKALKTAFEKAEELGAARKAIIFTESRKTQDYILRLLDSSPYSEGIVRFNGSNSDRGSRKIYETWLKRHKGTDRVTGSRTADMRSALVDYFRDEGKIMIATEAGAEGINLQFCSLVVNYDLPWNPQRIEQRIGRCHRYGQKHDVVVVNFLNQKNAADQHVYKLLDEKFKLFDGVFGASDEVLGAIESGVDFEKRIGEIYQRCRRPDQIKSEFDRLQRELAAEIDIAMSSTRKKLLDNFDDEVVESMRLRDTKMNAEASLGRIERQLMDVTRHELRNYAEFIDESAFVVRSQPFALSADDAPAGRYERPRRSPDAHIYRLNHPLAEAVLEAAKGRALPTVEVCFDYSAHTGIISTVAAMMGASGWLSLSQFSIEALDQGEDHLILSVVLDDGTVVEGAIAERLCTIPWRVGDLVDADPRAIVALETESLRQQALIRQAVSDRNAQFFAVETDKLDGWADDRKLGLEREIKEIDRAIKEVKRTSAVALTLEAKLAIQKRVRTLEAERNTKRKALFDAQDEVDRQRDTLIAEIETQLLQQQHAKPLFLVRWFVR